MTHTISLRAPTLCFDHLDRLTGRHGLYEHALLDRPRRSHGYTTDDNARALVVLARAGEDSRIRTFQGFVIAGRTAHGWHNRMSDQGSWTDVTGPDDSAGRAIWGLSMLPVDDRDAIDALTPALRTFDSHHPRAIAYAVLGLSHLVLRTSWPEAERCLERLAPRLPFPADGKWMWPSPQLTYDNGRIPEALIKAGSALGDELMLEAGLELLAWLVAEESGTGGFSFTPVGGRGRDETKPGYDQQPIEAWAMADAALAASRIDPSTTWSHAVEDAAMWFLGRNDVGAVLYDDATGAGHDGLERNGVNLNCGAESTLSALGALLANREIAVDSR